MNPSQLAEPCPSKTSVDLEWDRIREAVASRAATARGKRTAFELPFARSVDENRQRLSEAEEATRLSSLGDPLPIEDVPDMDPVLLRVKVEACLTNEELRGVLRCLSRARNLRLFLHTRRERVPELYKLCSTDPELDELEKVLAFSFDPDGSLSARASPELERLRNERKAVRDRLVRRLEELIAKHDSILQDRFWTERDGRYVLPVRADAHERFPGIVHASSASGATLFVEPNALIEMGNRVKMIEAQVSREEQAIYAALSLRVGEARDGIAFAARALGQADFYAALAKLSEELKLVFPRVQGEGAVKMKLLSLRHPLLVLDGTACVPSDIEVESGRGLVVSGPNAGGKTVALKALGLAALMTRAGMPIAATDGSTTSFVDTVLTDFGDDQSLRKNLSTFSAHVNNLAQILEASHRGVLVLLDEIATGTDPREGEALAASVLETLCARGAAVACTTHYEGLKALAVRDDRLRNASVGFDISTMRPTFRLTLGVPGASSALSVARRFGIPAAVLERAESFLGNEMQSFDELVAKLEADRESVRVLREKLSEEIEKVVRREQELEAEIERVRIKARRAIGDESDALLSEMRKARRELEQAEARLKAAQNLDSVREPREIIERTARKVSIGGEFDRASAPDRAEALEPEARLPPEAIRPGVRVYVPRLRAVAEVLEVSGKQVRVAAGPLKLTVSVDDVRRVQSSEGDAKKDRLRKGTAALDAATDSEVPIQSSENTVDLRGLRVHEAAGMLEQFLDRLLGAELRVGFVVHGHGTGAVRDAVRELLGKSPYICRQRPGTQSEGGDGVTVFWIR